MAAPDSSTITLLALLPLIVWRVIARFRRMIGRQRLSRIRPWITLILFPAILALLAGATHVLEPHRPDLLLWLGGGLAGGGLLALFGLKKTVFEATPEGLFYTPHAPLGIALSTLFLARIGWRVVEVLHHSSPHGPDTFTTSPLTLGVVGLMAGYYIAYAIGLVLSRFRMLRVQRAQSAQAAHEAAPAPAPDFQTTNAPR